VVISFAQIAKPGTGELINWAVAQGSIGIYRRVIDPIKPPVEDHESDGLTHIKEWWRSVVTNGLYSESIYDRLDCEANDGCRMKTSGRNALSSIGRFINGSRTVEKFAAQNALQNSAKSAWDFARIQSEVFAALLQFDQKAPLTTWNETYHLEADPQKGGPFELVFSFKRPEQTLDQLRWLEFKNPDFNCRQPLQVWMMDMESNTGGNVTGAPLPTQKNSETLKLMTYRHLNQPSPYEPGKVLFTKEYLDGIIAYAATEVCEP
jgi:hypothetical protein